MSRGISLHIGLNHVDTSAYPDFVIPVLAGCINDANAMCTIAKNAGFTTTNVLIDGQATALNVKNKIMEAADQLLDGDMFFLTYSGHGAQIPDETGQEEDGSNETWILYDRQLIDDELYAIWPRFKESVRIFALSDSCHSGTMMKLIIQNTLASKRTFGKRGVQSSLINMNDVNSMVEQINAKRSRSPMLTQLQKKAFPEVLALTNYVRNRSLYQNIQQLARVAKEADDIKAALIYISGCQDNQLSGDGATNGLFTGNLVSVWDQGNFSGTYKSFYDNILAKMPSDQTPNYMTLGMDIDPFESQKPFTVMSPSGTVTACIPPQITGPTTWNKASLPPTFTIDKGSNPLYYVEVTTDHNLFNYKNAGAQRNDTNFYATWNDASTGYQLLSFPQYQLSQNVWENLKTAEYIFYRVGSSMDDQWNGWMVSVSDENCASAPFFEIVAADVSTEQPQPVDSTDTGNSDATDTANTDTEASNAGIVSSDTSDTDNTNSDSEDRTISFRIQGTVGTGGTNRATDVRIIQRLLSRLSVADGGTTSLVVDGICGLSTIEAIKKFQRSNELNESGLFRPDRGSVLILYIKTKVATLTYDQQSKKQKIKPAVLS